MKIPPLQSAARKARLTPGAAGWQAAYSLASWPPPFRVTGTLATTGKGTRSNAPSLVARLQAAEPPDTHHYRYTRPVAVRSNTIPRALGFQAGLFAAALTIPVPITIPIPISTAPEPFSQPKDAGKLDAGQLAQPLAHSLEASLVKEQERRTPEQRDYPNPCKGRYRPALLPRCTARRFGSGCPPLGRDPI